MIVTFHPMYILSILFHGVCGVVYYQHTVNIYHHGIMGQNTLDIVVDMNYHPYTTPLMTIPEIFVVHDHDKTRLYYRDLNRIIPRLPTVHSA
jgi:hypothetical protein